MKKPSYQVITAFFLLILCVFMFSLHFLLFGQIQNTLYYSLMSLCFIPLNTLAVTIVFEELYKRRAKLERLSKLNMLVGTYFSEIGFDLLDILASADEQAETIILDFEDKNATAILLKNSNFDFISKNVPCQRIKDLLVENKQVLISLMSNEHLLEHEIFTDLLIATVHLRDEFKFHDAANDYTEPVINHLAVDTSRVYKALVIQWWDYMQYLKANYPYLYQNAKMRNPFKSSSAL